MGKGGSKAKKGAQLRARLAKLVSENADLRRELKELRTRIERLATEQKNWEMERLKLEDKLEWYRAQMQYEREERRSIEWKLTRRERRHTEMGQKAELEEELGELKKQVEKLDKKWERRRMELDELEKWCDARVNHLGSATLVLVDLPNLQAAANQRHGSFFPLQQVLAHALKARNPRVFLFANPATPYFKNLGGGGDNRVQVRRVTDVKSKGDGNGSIHYQDVDTTVMLVGTLQVASRNYDKMVLMSGDGDFFPLVDHARGFGLKVTVVGVEGTVASIYNSDGIKVRFITPRRVN
ncbi:MAG: hypothetical protein Kow0069_36200 [Promethearchaeota archaeon]